MSRHHLPTAVPEAEAAEDNRPLLWRVEEDIGPGLDALWLGNLPAAEDGAALQSAGISASLNLAMNIFPGPLQRPDGLHLRRYQIGMLDGPGNAPEMLAAAVSLIDGLAAVYTQGKPHYPAHAKGGLLVHCRGGRSRSVTVLALWLHLRRPGAYPTFDDALCRLRKLRGLDATYPLPPMLALAQEVLNRGLCAR
ncbi:dual specificity protein phosphatase family protein [Salipiger sp. PrR002]|uniref:dual specificity protein phosphatase family protein n=1 Tax=Salipiger sp. PrR002 TaxID=2706489 RepID=UPI0013B61752|nr:dual specificity protein phosphatase family protein [Salipiger sp. PrR002]NDW00472.1 dual specificity protein phosphatase family protein [Salipiger sp. PrR002]NDW56430.1 dual specificity protein phosphatase family protein [Salipiger sp. PrR004]